MAKYSDIIGTVVNGERQAFLKESGLITLQKHITQSIDIADNSVAIGVSGIIVDENVRITIGANSSIKLI
jgi:hypothetical protein